MLSVLMLSALMLNVLMLNDTMLNILILNVVMLSEIMSIVMVPSEQGNNVSCRSAFYFFIQTFRSITF